MSVARSTTPGGQPDEEMPRLKSGKRTITANTFIAVIFRGKRKRCQFPGIWPLPDGFRSGRYRFRTIRPVAYGSGFFRRTPHIHFAVSAAGYSPLSTQMYFTDEDNHTDGLWSRLSESRKESLLTDAAPQSAGFRH